MSEYTWDDDRQAQKYLHSQGYRLTKTFFYYHPKRKEPTEKEASAMSYMQWEWDYGHYMIVPPKKCKSSHVGQMGECLYCDAENGEACKSQSITTLKE